MKRKKNPIRILLLMVVTLSLILCGCGGSTSGAHKEAQDNQVAVTEYGKFIGLTRDSGVVSFLGVPYAQQPVGELRWKEAQPMEKSNEYIKAYDYGNTAIQPIDEFERASFAQQGEDCLSLNVWTRDVTGKKPVMVFIHGGANVSGGTTDPLYDGEKFVENNDVVMVSFNYRLGPFGFLDLSDFGGEEFENSRNLGVLDQIVALKWINENIESFGGDPENITVFGESAGASAIIRLMATPLAEGLFDKAIIESGGPASIRFNGAAEIDETEQSKIIGREFMKLTGKSSVEELQELTANEVQEYSDELAEQLGDSLDVSTYGAIADGNAVPYDVYQNIKDGVGKDVEVIIGTNKDELKYFYLYDPEFEKSLKEEYPNHTQLGRSFAGGVEAADKYIATQADNPDKYTDFAGHMWIKQPSIIFAELQSKYNNVYMYEWDWESNVEGLGACHASELAFVLGNFDAPTAIAYSGENLPEDLALRVQDAWASFAATGNPSIDGEVEWSKYTVNDRATMVIDDAVWKIVNDPDSEARKILKGLYKDYSK